MTSARTLAATLLALTTLAVAPACESKDEAAKRAAPAVATAIGIAECAACGMVVREQPAPRAQLIHRDGTREHLCSIDDLVQYLQAPSRHGRATSIWVEALEVDFNPAAADIKERPWIPAEGATYVVGVQREHVMGNAVLPYDTRERAQAAATKHGGALKTWPELEKFVLKKKK